ncbi:alpha-ketoacid dehydrogenase subunit beta [Sphingomonas sp. CGMCC 1.13654]|uniref:Alpha-ketoacid dehydrogenase subunit beta n=1 Tax=Sphingomonas chungangi TaxID=2683589 RepID=A0A838L2R1_9SPHN|nr:transketolase C-terminal domain-containing protein [Sphingomonas chungangi]MBA2933474.1 alpha-ketoacid dehydrogenase subunit beta [Sphingomonas chungangi]MVW54807.1 alpha-ketoacid dehydrogenase subunit beta [Sphingomonas chungangi]
MTRKRYTQAINEALHEEMARDPKTILFGEDVALAVFGDTRGLLAAFGPERVRNTPICEATIAGMAVGAAAAGYRVIVHMLFSNFIYTGFDAIANQMAKLRLMTGGQIDLPITVLAVYGGGASQAAQHSDSNHPVLMNLGGVDVLVPATPADAKGMLKTAIRNNRPSFFLQASGLGAINGDVPDGEHLQPLGRAAVVREGRHVSLISVGSMIRATQNAAKQLEKNGIDAEILDVRSLIPLDEDAIVASVVRTGRAVVVDEARDSCSAASQIAAVIADKGFSALRAPVKRVTVDNMSMPYAPNAEAAVFPNADDIVRAASSICQPESVQA